MGTVTISKNNRLFWLGRYAERVYQGVLTVGKIGDALLDEGEVDVALWCKRLGISGGFDSPEEFCERYPFDRTLPESIICSADAMVGNGMVLREVLGSQTLSYIQMALSALEAASVSRSNGLQLQWVLDDIMAFRGSYSEFVAEEDIRNTIKTGASVERVSTMLRLEAEDEPLKRELQKLVNRLYKTHLAHNGANLAIITEFVFGEEDMLSREGLLDSVESLFLI